MVQRHLAALKRRFSNQPNFLQTGAGVSELPFTSFDRHWIVGRGLCMYRHESFAHVPGSKREAALAHQVPVWSPFRETGHFCVWSGGTAMVWFWDAEVVKHAQQDVSSAASADDSRRWVTLPETVYRPRMSAGVSLLSAQDGFEIQYWRADVLADSFWYAEEPDERQIGWFLDRNGRGAEAVQRGGASSMNSQPWSTHLTPKDWLILNERRLVAVCLLALSVIVVWQEVRYWKIDALSASVAAEFLEVQDEIGPLLQARNETQRVRDSNRQLVEIVSKPSQALLMSIVDQSLPNESARFKEWHYQRGELRVIVEDPGLNAIEYVRLLEAQPLFGSVRAEQARGRDRIEIIMTVRA